MFDEPLHLNFRFVVSFLSWGGLAGAVDTRFQSVLGLSATLTTTDVSSGGQNLYVQKLPKNVTYGALTLERGYVVKSAVSSRFEDALYRFDFKTSDVLVILLNEIRMPVAAWKFLRAYPATWTMGKLDTATPGLLIETLTLNYTTMSPQPV